MASVVATPIHLSTPSSFSSMGTTPVISSSFTTVSSFPSPPSSSTSPQPFSFGGQTAPSIVKPPSLSPSSAVKTKRSAHPPPVVFAEPITIPSSSQLSMSSSSSSTPTDTKRNNGTSPRIGDSNAVVVGLGHRPVTPSPSSAPLPNHSTTTSSTNAAPRLQTPAPASPPTTNQQNNTTSNDDVAIAVGAVAAAGVAVLFATTPSGQGALTSLGNFLGRR
jgi:hypothetical protein